MPQEATHVRGWQAALALNYARRGARTVLASRRHEGPLVVQKALYPEAPEVCHTILVHPPGGIAGGDELSVAIDAGAAAHVLLTTPGASKWYRSSGPWARQRVTMTAGPDSCIEWLPQETIVYDGARVDMQCDVELAPEGAFIGWDIVCLGRSAHGELYGRGDFRLRMRIRRAERTIWLEQGSITAGRLVCRSTAGLGGCTVFGTLIAAAAHIDRELVQACRVEPASIGMSAITSPPGLLVARYLGDSGEAARRYFSGVWQRIRRPLVGREAAPPRIWSA